MRNRFVVLPAALLSCAAFAQVPPTLDKVKSSGEITVAHRESSIPFSYLGEGGKLKGALARCQRSPVLPLRAAFRRPRLRRRSTGRRSTAALLDAAPQLFLDRVVLRALQG